MNDYLQHRASQVVQWQRIHLPIQEMQETWVWYLGQEDPSRVGNGNLLQYSCLENSMDRGAWRAIVHGLTKSQKQLSAHKTGEKNLKNR